MSAPQCPFNGGDHRLQVDPDKPCPVCGDYGDYRAWEDDNCVEPREPLTSHAVAAAEIARLRAEVAALREALETERVEARAMAQMRAAEDQIWKAEQRDDDAALTVAHKRHSEACEVAEKAYHAATAARAALAQEQAP